MFSEARVVLARRLGPSSLGLVFAWRDSVLYDPDAPFQGHVRDARAGFTLQPTGRLSQAFSYRRVAFDRRWTGERVYDLDILFSRTTCQSPASSSCEASSSSTTRGTAS